MNRVKTYVYITLGTFLIVIGAYFFKFPNHFSFGGITGIAVVISELLPYSASLCTTILNIVLLFIGFTVLGKNFGIKTVYATVLTSVLLAICEKMYPMEVPFTNEPVLELIFAIFLPAVGAAILFNIGASGGGTDIIAMIIKKHFQFNIGIALFIVDLVVTLLACIVFDIQTGLFSMCGLMAKTFVIDLVIENINMCKYFNIICQNPEPICQFIIHDLNRSATIYRVEGAYSHKEKAIILTAMKRGQAIQLRNYVKNVEPEAFILISNTSEIIGKGFMGF